MRHSRHGGSLTAKGRFLFAERQVLRQLRPCPLHREGRLVAEGGSRQIATERSLKSTVGLDRAERPLPNGLTTSNRPLAVLRGFLIGRPLSRRCSRRNFDDSAEVFPSLEAQNLDRATVLSESLDLREKMPPLRVVNKPDICFRDS